MKLDFLKLTARPPAPGFAPLSTGARYAVLLAAFAGLVFDGMEIGRMPVASLSISASLLGPAYTPTLGGDWFARYTAALMLGASVGGILLGSLGDRLGRTRTMGISILFYSVFAGLGAYAKTQEQMLLLRFLVGLGVGGMWPTGVALVAECWPNKSRPVVAGILGAGTNAGVLVLSQLARVWPLTPDSWRWLFQLSAVPTVLGLAVLFGLPESPRWLATRGTAHAPQQPLRELFRPDLIRLTIIGILLGSIPLVGAWSGSKWMIPWADKLASATHPGYKAIAQGWWALGATMGSFLGAQVAALYGRRTTYFLISLATTVITVAMFQFTEPLKASFLPIVFVQGFVATLFFGWLALYLPELFPTRVRASGSGLAMNIGRFATAAGIFLAGALFTALGGSYSKTGTICALVYALGLIVIWWAPDTSKKDLSE
jgi:MFS transporter, SHS family, sialic acid transporter